jgi:hypothetical protein
MDQEQPNKMKRPMMMLMMTPPPPAMTTPTPLPKWEHQDGGRFDGHRHTP